MIKRLKKMNSIGIMCLSLAIVLIGILVYATVSYAYWSKTYEQTTANAVKGACFSLNFHSDSQQINLTNTYPMSEAEAMTADKYYQFTITNTCTTDMYYNVTLNSLNTNVLDNSIAYKLIDENNNVVGPKILGETTQYTEYNNKTYSDTNGTVNINTSYILSTGFLGKAIMDDSHTNIITPGESKTYKLYLWIDEDVTSESTMNKTFNGKIIITSSTASRITGTYKEEILNGTDPVLTDDLVPVIIADNGDVKKANTGLEWYNYNNSRWANAVVLNSEDTYEAGDTIDPQNIDAYFVWVPRYKYQISNNSQYEEYVSGEPATFGSDAKKVKIKFENKNTTSSAGTNNGDWLTHPAFVSMNTNGMWVGKFETTGDSSKMTVLPNTASFRGQTVKGFFDLALAYNSTANSHMMKNTEWGAVAYLYHSQYGRCSSNSCEDIRINNNQSYLTGYAATDVANVSSYPGSYGADSAKTLGWTTSTGYKASTTGNISGIYDMNGGTAEYVVGYRTGIYGASGFASENIGNYDAKYFDTYEPTLNASDYSKRILGDATGEIGPFYYYSDGDAFRSHNNWYSDISNFVYTSSPWFVRGGMYSDGVIGGIFAFQNDTGRADNSYGMRLVLAP